MLTVSGWEDVFPSALRYEVAEPEFRGLLLGELAEDGCREIVERTLRGEDKNGQQFDPYGNKFYVVKENDDYFEKALQSGGRYDNRENTVTFGGGYDEFKAGLGVDVPNLVVKGRLLGVEDYEGSRPFDVTLVDAAEWKAEVGWTRGDLADIADKHIDGTEVPQRDFYGFAEEGNAKEWNKFNDKCTTKYDEFLTAHFEGVGWL